MPRAPRRQITTIQGPTGMVAAAVSLNSKKKRKPRRPPGWYNEAWRFFDTIGEYRYSCTWVGNLLSRATLEVHENGKVTTNADALAGLAALFGGVEGQREMLRQLGVHLTVAGDAYIVGEDQGDEPDEWSVVAATQITAQGSDESLTWKVGNHPLDNPLVIRLWRPHPQKHKESDAPSRAVLPILSELEMLSKYVAAQGTSRLAGSGILALPSEMTFGSVRAVDNNGDQVVTGGSADAFLEELMLTMETAIDDPDDPSAKVPIILQGPGESIERIKHLTFWTEFDEQTKLLRDEAIRRLALGMDMPPEILTGSGELNHWNAWQVEEASIKAHTEPLLQIITNSLTTAYLRPYLESVGMSEEDARAYTIHADTSKIRLRPNRSKEAIELYEHGELSARSMLIENGFDPDVDMPTDEERRLWLTRKVASGSASPGQVEQALRILGIDIQTEAPAENMRESRPEPSIREHPVNEIPEQGEDMSAAMVAAWRALERAGAKLRTKYAGSLVSGTDKISNDKLYRYATITTEMADDLLAGAWDCVDELELEIPPAKLDRYVRDLFRTNQSLSPRTMKASFRGMS